MKRKKSLKEKDQEKFRVQAQEGKEEAQKHRSTEEDAKDQRIRESQGRTGQFLFLKGNKLDKIPKRGGLSVMY